MNNNTSNTQQALWLALSSFSSLALAFVSSAILSRYFDKTEYGTYRQILYIYVTLQTIFTIGLPSVFSYFIPKYTHQEGKYFVNKINSIFVILGILFSIILYCFSGLIAQLLNNPELKEGLKIFSIFPVFTLPSLGVEGLYLALKKTKYIAIYSTINKLLMLVCIIIPVVFFGGGYKIALIGWGTASFLIFLYAMYMKSKPYFNIRKQKIENFYKTVFNYSIPLMLASLVGFFIASSNQFFISRYYGTEKFAEFANGFISLPIIGMVSGSIKAVLLPLFSKAQKDDKIQNAVLSYESAVLKSVTLIFPLILFSIFFASDIVSLVYGKLYLSSATFFRIALTKDLFELLPYLSVLLATGHSKIYFKSHLFSAIFLILISYIFAKMAYPPVTIVILFVIIEVIRHIYLLNYIKNKEGINLISNKLLQKILIIFTHISIVLITIYFLSKFLFFPELDLKIQFVCNLLIFYILVLFTQKIVGFNYLSPIINLIKK